MTLWTTRASEVSLLLLPRSRRPGGSACAELVERFVSARRNRAGALGSLPPRATGRGRRWRASSVPVGRGRLRCSLRRRSPAGKYRSTRGVSDRARVGSSAGIPSCSSSLPPLSAWFDRPPVACHPAGGQLHALLRPPGHAKHLLRLDCCIPPKDQPGRTIPVRPSHQRRGRRRRWLLRHASGSHVRLQVSVNRAASKHAACPATTEKQGQRCAGHRAASVDGPGMRTFGEREGPRRLATLRRAPSFDANAVVDENALAGLPARPLGSLSHRRDSRKMNLRLRGEREDCCFRRLAICSAPGL